MSDGVDRNRRRFLTTTTAVVGGVGAAFVAVPFIKSMMPSERAKAVGAPVEVDISKLQPGQRLIAQWRGKPVLVVRRSEETLEWLKSKELEEKLRDPESEVETQQPPYCNNIHRSIKPENLVLIGICTHLGCSPNYLPPDAPSDLGPDWKGGFLCPCHGSKFDMAGRVYKGVPAPTNLVVPPHKYESDTLIVVGVDQGA